jgi:tetratricopeptide (TPR) repeat protein
VSTERALIEQLLVDASRLGIAVEHERVARLLTDALRGNPAALAPARDEVDAILDNHGVLGELRRMLPLLSDAALASLRGAARLEWQFLKLRAELDVVVPAFLPPPPGPEIQRPVAAPTLRPSVQRSRTELLQRFVSGPPGLRRRLVATAIAGGTVDVLRDALFDEPSATGELGDFFVVLADLLRLRGDLADAADALDNAERYEAPAHTVLGMRVELAEARGDNRALVEALRVLGEICDDEQYRLLALRRASVLHENLDDLDAAVDTLREVIESRRHDANIVARLLGLLRESGRHAEAVDICRHAATEAEDEADRIEFLQQMADSARYVAPEAEIEAIEQLQACGQASPNLLARLVVARSLAAPTHDEAVASVAGLFIDAAQCLGEARTRNPSDAFRALDAISAALAAKGRWVDVNMLLETMLVGGPLTSAIPADRRPELFERLAVAVERLNTTGGFPVVR